MANTRLEGNAHQASASFRELFRYRKNGRIRSYNICVLDEDTAELWVVTGPDGAKSRRLATFSDADDTMPFVEGVEQELRAGGWIQG